MSRGEELHSDRDGQHGNFIDNAWITGSIMRALQSGPSWAQLDDVDELTIRMIAHKLARIASGDSQFDDHWDDIEGYIVARRTAKRMQDSRMSQEKVNSR